MFSRLPPSVMIALKSVLYLLVYRGGLAALQRLAEHAGKRPVQPLCLVAAVSDLCCATDR
jgi:hypothetical protein